MIINRINQHQKKVAWVLFFLFYADMVLAAYGGKSYTYFKTSPKLTRSTISMNGSEAAKYPNYFDLGNSSGTRNDDHKPFDVRKGNVLLNKKNYKKHPFIGGPGQPEMQAFQSVNANNMVDLFSGDFSYNIPLMDVGGYPIGLSYHGGVTMDQEATWVGLGWNVNPGTISRNVRGLPDDFNGTESITKEYNILKNWTAGVSASFKPELFGFNIPSIGLNVGAFYNNYAGVGFEAGATASINPAKYMFGTGTNAMDSTKMDTSYATKFSPSLNFSINSQSGLNLGASLMYGYNKQDALLHGTGSLGLNYNSRAGLQDLQLSCQAYLDKKTEATINANNHESWDATLISFAKTSYTPTITMPFTHKGFSLTLKGGGALFGFHPLGDLKGYYSQQYLTPKDRLSKVKAYGYMYYDMANGDDNALLDFNREKDIPFRTQTPHSAIPVYTYDSYSISGEGIGGSFRPYRGDVGYTKDHFIKNKNENAALGIDLGATPNIAHIGGNIQLTYATVANRAWTNSNFMEPRVRFGKNNEGYEAVYFRNPGEQTTNSQDYYDRIGGDDVVRIGMAGSNLEPIATNTLKKFDKQKYTGAITVTSPIIKTKRDKRSQVISYLTADEASRVGLDTIIKSYPINVFPKGKCDNSYSVISRNDGVDGIRKPNHLSEITVLNGDGRRYVYGIPAYNLGQKEETFAVDQSNANPATGLVGYTPNLENSTNNDKGKDHFFSSESTPAFAHSFLLTALLSPDYVDITGDGVTEDDNGDAVKFNYSKMHWNFLGTGIDLGNFKWRAPYYKDSANYNEGLKTDKTDDKGNVVYGEKEIWYLNSIESKTMLATFILDTAERRDSYGAKDENGGGDPYMALKRLKQINLYSKADYYKDPVKAKPIKIVHFGYSYTLCKGSPGAYDVNTGKLTLDSVWFTYNGNNRGSKNKYRFKYNSYNPTYNVKSYDRWGNYKPDTDNPGSALNADYPYAVQNKTKADNNAGAWSLVQVNLPSGAKINVTYEADDYAYVQDKRSMNMFKVAGMGPDANWSHAKPYLYNRINGDIQDARYVFVDVPTPVVSSNDIYQKYFENIQKLNFRIRVKMPSDVLGSGSETIPFYAEYDTFGVVSGNPNKIWIKLKEFGHDQTFPAVAAIQFLRLNLPSKAYPGSDLNGDADFRAIVQSIKGMGTQFKDAVTGFSMSMRRSGQCKFFDTAHSYVRLDNPDLIKYGGGYRVKKIVISDNWNSMTGQKESYYGQQYDYTENKEVFYDSLNVKKSKIIKISSGVATYEPNIGGEENPFRQPIEFNESVTMAPTDYLYSEYPYCESYFPSPSVGYSKVVVSSINKRNLKSFNGWEETDFYTTKDFPTLTDYTTFDDESRKRGKRKLNFINTYSVKRTTLSQGFKVELNDMNGKMKSQKSYAANDSIHPMAYTINYFQTVTDNIHGTRLSNTVAVMDSADGKINPASIIGKDMELMMDFREQQAMSTSVDVNANIEAMVLVIFPITIPAFFPRFNIDDNRYRSAVTVKVIQRYGIVDSVVHYEKGSLVSTKNMVYDAETGDVLLSRTQNEFNDPIYNFNYPAHWKYSGMEPAYKNIGAIFSGLNIDGGHITNRDISPWLESGDEVMVVKSDPTGYSCASYAQASKAFNSQILWVIDGNKTSGASGRDLFLMDRYGNPYSSSGVTLKIIRSGKRNNAGVSLGSITTLKDPVIRTSVPWQLKLDSVAGVIATGAAVFKDIWKVDNRFVSEHLCDTITTTVNHEGYFPTKSGLTRIETYGSITHDASPPTDINSPFFTGAFYEAGANTGVCRSNDGKKQSSPSRYISRGILAFDSLKKIPRNAVVSSAILTLNPIPPRNIWLEPHKTTADIPFCYWNTVTAAHSLPTTGTGDFHSLENPSTLSRIIDPWNSTTTLFRYDLITSPHNVTAIPQSTEGCEKYDLECNGLIQDFVSNPMGSYGILMKLNRESNPLGFVPAKANDLWLSHMSFYAGYHGDTPDTLHVYDCIGKKFMPSLDISYSYKTVYCRDTCISVFNRRFNPYVQGIWGNWRMDTSFTFYDARKQSNPEVATDIRRDGEFKHFVPYWNFSTTKLSRSGYDRWVWNSKITQFNKRGLEIENTDPLGRFNSGLYGYNQTLPIAVAQNAKYRQIAFDGFEDYDYKSDDCDQRCPPARHFDFSFYKNKIDTAERHTGKASLRLNSNETDSVLVTVSTFSQDSLPGILTSHINSGGSCHSLDSLTTNTNIVTSIFSPIQGDSMVLSAWVKESKECNCDAYTNNQIDVVFRATGTLLSSVTLKPTGNIIEGWQRYEEKIKVPATATQMKIALKNNASGNIYFDDIRLFPFNGNMKSFVYNPVNLRLMSELDENNYASFYEYDDEGTLVRVKKETQRGIKTIQETRSVLLKQ